MKASSRIAAAAAVALLAAVCQGAEAPADAPLDQWYPFTATGNPGGEIGLTDWLDKPAGVHGRITRKADQLLYNNAPIKLWGLNLCFGNCLPTREMADQRAAFYSKYGINSVRLHKFTESDYTAPDSVVEFNPEAVERMDYQVAKFKEAGIYTTLSAHFGSLRVGPADRKYVPYIDEFGSFDQPDSRGNKPRYLTLVHSALFYSPELQDLHIAQIVNLLKHKNAHTGLTYAQDPAIAFIEIVNEQSILFYTSTQPLKRYPTIRKMTGERFTDWLLKKYGSEEALKQAWGERGFEGLEGFDEPQSVAARNILPLATPWYFEPENLNGSQTFRRQRLLDTLEFLTLLQNECYDRYVKAVREAGYEGEVLGSNWQAGQATSHYANLFTDYRVGTIDRHNYFGGGGRINERPFNNASMLQRAGAGLLSTGMQQVIDRPFMLSEWIHVFPSEWGVEGPAIISAYGMGLQGWDASYMFQNGDSGRFSTAIGREAWDVTAPQIMAVFPAVARQIHRGDVKQSETVAARNVHEQSLYKGQLGFDDQVRQGYDEKELDSKVIPAKSLAAVRSVVAFTDKPEPTAPFDMQPFVNGNVVTASTKQLAWHEGKNKLDGFFTINTPGTQGVIGFAAGETIQLGDVTITPESRYAAIYVTALGKDGALASADKVLITAIARARNTGMEFSPAGDLLKAKGKAPVLMEPVKASIRANRQANVRVEILDHDGNRTGRTIEPENEALVIDGARDKSPYYYLIEVQR